MIENIDKFCYADNCWEHATRKGLCNKHYQRMYLYGRLEKVKGVIKGNCTVEGCNKKVKGHELCANHYQLWRRNGKAEKLKREKRNHPFYALWFERKQGDYLCEEWLDFTTFVRDISPKPEGDYFLLRIDGTKPFGPNNFRWQEHLKRKEGESKKDWWARKRAARIAANPSMDRARNYKKYFGITIEAYEQKLKQQNYVCAICCQPEISVDPRTSSIRRLAIDHCHNSNKIRDLLCYRCNSTLGKIEDNVELLQKMIDYLNKHKDVSNGL